MLDKGHVAVRRVVKLRTQEPVLHRFAPVERTLAWRAGGAAALGGQLARAVSGVPGG